jgi:LysM repeat protein
MKKLRLSLAALTAMMLLASPTIANAINYGGIGMTPANPRADNPRTKSIFIFELKPGQQMTDAVKVQNNTSNQQDLTLDAVDSELASGGAFTCKQAVEAKNDVGSWISLSQTNVSLAPNSSKDVPFTVSVPDSKHISVGEHDGCITLQAASQTSTKSNQSGILLSFRSAIRVVVTIPGKIIKKLTITQVGISKNKDGSYKVTPVVSNEGNVSLDTSLQIKNVSLLGITSSTIKEGTTPVLPHTSASWNYKLPRPFWGGFYTARVTASYNSNPSTELGVNNSADQETVSKDSATYFVFPSPKALIIELSVVIALIAAVSWLIGRRKHKKHVKKTWDSYILEEGDTIQSLAKEFKVPWKKIAAVNKLKPPYDLYKGQKIKLPPEKR